MSTTSTGPTTITDYETAQVERANATTATPVVFIHGLWLLPSSWEPWAKLFEEAGYVAVTPGWPDDPQTVEEQRPTRTCSHARASARWSTTSTGSFTS